jgi:hypothetical protein
MSLILLGILNSQAAAAGGGAAYDLLETQTLASSAASVTFTGLGSYTDYKHLQIRATVKAAGLTLMRFNGDTGSNYADHRLQGDGSLVESYNRTSQTSMIAGRSANAGTNIFGPLVCDILDFSSTNKNTTIRTFSANLYDNLLSFGSGFYNITSAITSIELFESSSFFTGCRFSLYGVK